MSKIMFLENYQYRKIDHPEHKYEMIEEFYFIDPNIVKYKCDHDFFSIGNGCITARKGYAWDGCSGPTIDDDTNMRASLFHDIWYQAMSEKLLPRNWRTRRAGDKLFLKILKEDGMPWYRRTAYFYSVRGAGALFAYF